MIETPTKPQFQLSSMPWKNVWVNILYGAAVIERPDFDQWKKLVFVNEQNTVKVRLQASLNQKLSFA